LDTKKEALLAALTKCKGIVTDACKAAKIPRSTHYNWLKTDAEYQQAVEDLNEIALDFGEKMLFKLMENENATAVIFFLKTKGKKRGYVERQEITGAEGAAVEVNYDLSKLSLKELKTLESLKHSIAKD
jgi:hypothetical protein